MGNLSAETVGVAKLVANKGNSNATQNYNVYLNISKNDFVYTTEDNKAELILTVIDPNGNEVTSIDGLTYVTNGDVSGFDITKKSGLTNIALDYVIESNSSTKGTIQTWKFKVTFVNLDTNQQTNTGKKFIGEIQLIQGEFAAYEAIAIYSEDDNSLRFYNITAPIQVGDVYNGLTVTNLYTDFENSNFNNENKPSWKENMYDCLVIVVEDIISPINTAYWFEEFYNVKKIDVTKLDTSQVTNMERMFYNSGIGETALNNLSRWDVSNVTNMSYMFASAGSNVDNWYIGDLNNWNTSKVTNMNQMFCNAGYNAKTWSIGDISEWDVSSVTNMESMFSGTAYSALEWNIGNISKWNTSKVTIMSWMFENAGNTATYTLDLSGWKVPLVTSYTDFNLGVETKVTPPTWVN